MLYLSNQFKFELAERPVIGGSSYRVNGESFNPTVRLRSGERYEFEVNVPPPHGLLFKHSVQGRLALLEEVQNNGSYTGTLTWAVTKTSPREVIYQSSAEESIVGLILVDSDPVQTENGAQLARLDGWADSIPQLVDKFNHNARLFLSYQENFAGSGLTLKDRKLSLNSEQGTVFYKNQFGQVARVDERLALSDSGTLYQNAMGLLETLNFIAQEIRRIKNPARPWFEPTSINIEALIQKVQELESTVDTLDQLYTTQQNNYTRLLERYRDLLKQFQTHKHKASDLNSGILAPARLGLGNPTDKTYLRGDGRWSAP